MFGGLLISEYDKSQKKKKIRGIPDSIISEVRVSYCGFNSNIQVHGQCSEGVMRYTLYTRCIIHNNVEADMLFSCLFVWLDVNSNEYV